MISISRALKIIERETAAIGIERVDLRNATGRVLAEDILADTDLPPFDRSMMDGYAVIAADTKAAPVTLKIVGESAAGRGWHNNLRRGEAVRIMTGAPVPRGADAVQKIELTSERGEKVTVLEPIKKGHSVVKRAAEIKRGKRIFEKGELITENMIASLASFGHAKVTVKKRPRIAILGTGSEIVDVAKKPGRDQIRNSNSAMLDALCRKFGAETDILQQVRDDVELLKEQISKAVGLRQKRGKAQSKIENRQSKILIVTGGVSVGKYDHTKTALTALGAEIFFDKVCLKPGKPTVFARLGQTLIFGLPGNPVSAAVTFQLFVRKAILGMQSAVLTDLKRGSAVLSSDAKAARDRDTFVPARLETNRSGQLVANPLKSQGSSDFVGFARADALVFVAKGKIVKAGEIAAAFIL